MDGALVLHSQGPEHLWSLELNRGKSREGEGVCVFSRTHGKGTQDDLCKSGLEVLIICSPLLPLVLVYYTVRLMLTVYVCH